MTVTTLKQPVGRILSQRGRKLKGRGLQESEGWREGEGDGWVGKTTFAEMVPPTFSPAILASYRSAPSHQPVTAPS